VRKKAVHPATYPLALARQCIELLTHRGELVVDPFVGSGTTLVAARDSGRSALGVDLKPEYVELAEARLAEEPPAEGTVQRAAKLDARHLPEEMEPGTAALILTSPPYANCLNRERRNKSRRSEDRVNDQYGQVEQYSQDPADLGTLGYEDYCLAMEDIFRDLRRCLRPGGHCVVNVPDIWWNDERIPLHVGVIEALTEAGYEFRNTIIWDKTNIVNRMGIFGWPSNYITAGVTFEYLLHFRARERRERPDDGNGNSARKT
jgi:DNA modification methylase